jgi:hypothetical protein
MTRSEAHAYIPGWSISYVNEDHDTVVAVCYADEEIFNETFKYSVLSWPKGQATAFKILNANRTALRARQLFDEHVTNLERQPQPQISQWTKCGSTIKGGLGIAWGYTSPEDYGVIMSPIGYPEKFKIIKSGMTRSAARGFYNRHLSAISITETLSSIPNFGRF